MRYQRRTRCKWAFLSGLVVLLGLQANAMAGCPDVCTATATEPVLVPPLDCLSLRTSAGSCDCEAAFEVANNCDTDVEAVGFTFITCGPVASYDVTDIVRNGSTIYPKYSCRRTDKLSGVGKTDYEYHFIKDGTEYTLTYQADVTSYDDSGCMCSTPGHPSRSYAATLAGLALLIGASRRRR